MSKKMLIDATHSEETRVVVVDGTKVEEFDFETVNKRQLAGNIYLAKVTRVEPSLQAAFVDYGGNRHGFLAFAEIHPDYYQIPAADRKALIEEERQAAAAESEEAEKPKRNARRRKAPKAAAADAGDAVVVSDDIPGMTIVDTSEADTLLEDETAGDEPAEVSVLETQAVELSPENSAEEGEDHGDDGIESVAEEDVTEEIRAPKRPRARRYKIQEVIKVRQIMLVQVVKEERGNKGAALTTYLSLAGRYCVLMPNTARGGGISRKITNAADRKKLKEIASELEVPEGAGLIIRTAGSQRTRTEIRRDYEYLMRLWEQIRELTFKSVAPAPVYEEGDLIKRTIRDIYSKEIDEVLVEGERGYRTAKDFMKMIMPSHAKNVKHYTEQMPLYARFQVESYLSGMFNPVVQLKSGGYIVIGFIDMEERKNNAAVEKRFKDKLKTDRARIQVGRISGFGLLEMSRQRLRPGMLESTTQPCAHCHGTGLIRSDDSLALTILRAIEEEGTRKRSREVLVKAPVAVANFLMNAKREHIAGIEARYGMSVRVEADPSLISPDFAIEKFKTATRNVPEVASPVVSVDARLMAQIDEDSAEVEVEEEVEIEEAAVVEDSADESRAEADGEGEAGGKSRRRRRRRRRGGKNGDAEGENGDEARAESGDESGDEGEAALETVEVALADVVEAEAAPVAEDEGKPRRRTRSRRRKSDDAEVVAEVAVEAVAESVMPEAVAAAEAAELPEVIAEPAPVAETAVAEVPVAEVAVVEAVMAEEPAAEVPETAAEEAPQPAEVAQVAPETPAAAPRSESVEVDEAPRPKRRGWWSLG
jgi:ribonuclease E